MSTHSIKTCREYRKPRKLGRPNTRRARRTTAGGAPFFHPLTTNFTARVAIRRRRLGFSDGLICSSRKEVRLSVMLPSRDRVLLFSRFPGYGLECNRGTEGPPNLDARNCGPHPHMVLRDLRAWPNAVVLF